MKLTNLVIALATFATITLSSSAYIATNEVTSAVLVDKAKHSLDLTTNGLHNISVGEAFTIDKSEAAQINFLRCSFARPEFRFSWFCHQLKSDGKMTKQSYVALKADQEKYFKENVIKSVAFEARKLFEQSEQLSTLAKIQRAHKTAQEKPNVSGVNGEARAVDGVEQGTSKSINEISMEALKEFNLSDVIERFDSRNSPSSVKDFQPDSNAMLRNIDKGFLAGVGLVAADDHETKNAGVGKKEVTTNAKIVAGISILICLLLIVVLIVAFIREIKKLEKKLLNSDSNINTEGGSHE
ncbi:hypothetical protein ACI51W_03355 [Pseudomonas marginalis]|uniref:hypothetical protein n=1 Tax=Pseudomonas marginalis TaxID=298 RepID=UPI00386B5E2D